MEVDGVGSNTAVLAVDPTRPGIFTFGGGSGQGAALNQNNSVNGATDPAPRGSVIQIYVTGGGQTNPPIVVGGIAPLTPLSNLTASVQVQVGGVNAPVLFAGAAPQFVFGLVQINGCVK